MYKTLHTTENIYGEDIIKIQHIYSVLESWQNKIPSTTIIDELEREVDCLELKYDLNDLSYYLSPLCIKIKNEIKNEKVNVFTGEEFDGFTTTYEKNLETLGINDLSEPSTINIYPKDYDAKESIENIINKYNKEHSDDEQITYTDYVGVLMSGITTIVNVITYVLIAFVAISLVYQVL